MHKAVRTVMNTSVILLYCYTEDVIKYLFCGAFSLLFSSKTKTEQKHTHCTQHLVCSHCTECEFVLGQV